MSNNRILLADNNQDFLDTRATFLRDAGYVVETVGSPQNARRLLVEQWYHLVILDNRLDDDNNARDLSGLKLARDGNVVKAPCIILTAYPDDLEFYRTLLPEHIRVLAKQDDPEVMVQAVRDILAHEARIQWDLKILPAGLEVAPAHLLDRLEKVDPLAREERVEELEDLLRGLFFGKDSLWLRRVLWQRKNRLAVLASAKKGLAGQEHFVVTLGDCASAREEAERWREFAPAAQGDTATVLRGVRETTRFGANLFAIYVSDIGKINVLEDVFRRQDKRPISAALEALFDRALQPWYRGIRRLSDRPLDALYRERLGLDPRQAPCQDLQERVLKLVREGSRIVPGIKLDEKGLTVPVGRQTRLYLNPAQLLLEPMPMSREPWIRGTPGVLSGKSILCDGGKLVWLTDFLDAGDAPELWNFTSVEALVRFDQTRCRTVDDLVGMERLLTRPDDLEVISQADGEFEVRQCLQVVNHIRKAARKVPGGDVRSYHRGMFFHAVRRLACYRHDPGLDTDELKRFLHMLVSAAIIGTVAANLSAPAAASTLVLAEGGVTIGDQFIRLKQRQMDIVRFLHRNDRLCGRREVFEAANPDERFRDDDESQNDRLDKDVAELRKAIGKDRIETRSKLGYRLLPPTGGKQETGADLLPGSREK